jgi:predicted ATPase
MEREKISGVDMRLNSLDVDNFRMLQELSLDGLQGLNVFIGPNATGKSTVLQSLNLLLQSSNINVDKDFAFRGSPYESIRIECGLTLSAEDIKQIVKEMAVRQTGPMPAEKTRVELARHLDGNLILRYSAIAPQQRGLTVGASRQMLMARKRIQDHLQSLSARRTVQWASPDLIEQEITRFVSERTIYLQTARRVSGTLGVGRVSKPSPTEIGQWLHQLMGEKRPEFRRYEKLLTGFLPHTKGIIFKPAENVFRLGMSEENLPDMTPGDVWSSGTLHLSLFAAFRSLPSGSVVLVEEPELSLHPAAIRKLMDEIHHLVSDGSVQFFLTTHSPVVVEGIDPQQSNHSLWQFRRNADGSASAIRCASEREIDEAVGSLLRRE